MAGFDDLSPDLRLLINYAETPEEGAQPVRECLISLFGPQAAKLLLRKM